MPYVIGIGGPSRSGKSRLAKQIIDHLSKRKGIHIDMDDYVLPVSKIPKIGNQTDWESSRSVDFKKLISAVRKGSNDYDLVIVEGILIFEDDDNCFYSPWRRAFRPIRGIYHGVITFAFGHYLFFELLENEIPSNR